MPYLVLSIPARGDAAACAELNQFLALHRVTQVDRQMVIAGDQSFWTFCVSYAAGATQSEGLPTRMGKIDYREVLSPGDFAIYSRLRDLRRDTARNEGVPPYNLFTNEQLAAIVTGRVVTKAALAAIDGVGPARVEKYGEQFLIVMREWLKSQRAASSAPAEPGGHAPQP